MARRRISSAQARSKIRQAQARSRQSIQKINRAIREYNSAVRRYNTQRRQAIDAYNRSVRSHNARVRANRSRLQFEIGRLSQQSISVQYDVLYRSVHTLSVAYDRLDSADVDPRFSDLAEQETANSIAVLNNLVESPDDQDLDYESEEALEEELESTLIGGILGIISSELNNRWRGALHALSPNNPDAARHFCTSTREILTQIIDRSAPRDAVKAQFPNDVSDKGIPTRRARIQYLLDLKGKGDFELVDFADKNTDDVLKLFDALQSGTHGPAGTYTLVQLDSIKSRAEDAIRFLHEISSLEEDS